MTDIMKLAAQWGDARIMATRDRATNDEVLQARDALQSAIEALQGEVERLKADYLEVERLCDATYVAKGADAYNHACDEMERFQDQRRKAGKEVGTERSLCDGMAWLYQHVSDVEAERDALQAENEQFRLLAKANSEALGAALVERDALQAKLDAMGKGEPVAYSVGNTLKWHEGKGMTNAQLYAAPKALAPLAIPADVLEAAVNMKTNHYRGPLAWAVKVIDFVADHGIGGTP